MRGGAGRAVLQAGEQKGAAMTEWQRHIGAMTLLVPDLDQARAFYRDVFGLEVQDADPDTLMVRFGDMYVFLHRDPSSAGTSAKALEQAQTGAGQFAIIVADVDAVHEELTGNGMTPISGPADRDWGMRTVTFADPAGHIWEIAQELPGDPAS
jgi:catechol 2,3-dioxygenase-like lactoylglutathione lyase family enzyme